MREYGRERAREGFYVDSIHNIREYARHSLELHVGFDVDVSVGDASQPIAAQARTMKMRRCFA